MIIVRDRWLREADPIFGVVPINLRQIFEEHGMSQVTQCFPLGGGQGHGAARISILFQPLEAMYLDRSKLRFDLRTMLVHSSPRVVDLHGANFWRFCSIRMRTLVGKVEISSRSARPVGGSTANDVDPFLEHGTQPQYRRQRESLSEIEWHVPSSQLLLSCPVRQRYSTPLIFEFRKPSALDVKSAVEA